MPATRAMADTTRLPASRSGRAPPMPLMRTGTTSPTPRGSTCRGIATITGITTFTSSTPFPERRKVYWATPLITTRTTSHVFLTHIPATRTVRFTGIPTPLSLITTIRGHMARPKAGRRRSPMNLGMCSPFGMKALTPMRACYILAATTTRVQFHPQSCHTTAFLHPATGRITDPECTPSRIGTLAV